MEHLGLELTPTCNVAAGGSCWIYCTTDSSPRPGFCKFLLWTFLIYTWIGFFFSFLRCSNFPSYIPLSKDECFTLFWNAVLFHDPTAPKEGKLLPKCQIITKTEHCCHHFITNDADKQNNREGKRSINTNSTVNVSSESEKQWDEQWKERNIDTFSNKHVGALVHSIRTLYIQRVCWHITSSCVKNTTA